MEYDVFPLLLLFKVSFPKGELRLEIEKKKKKKRRKIIQTFMNDL